MKKLLLIPLLLTALSCTETVKNEMEIVSLRVTFDDNNLPACGATETEICPFSLVEGSFSVNVHIEALREDHTVNTSFNRSVMVSTVPAGKFTPNAPNVYQLDGNRYVYIVQLTNGEWQGDIPFQGAFGEVSLFVEDVGYEPAANAATAACINAYPAAGCYAKDDDNPENGSGAAGVSPSLFFDNPLIADIQRPEDESAVGGRDGDITPLDGFRVQVDGDAYLGDDTCGPAESRLVVTQVGVAGFYVTDVCNRDPGTGTLSNEFASLYVYNFNTPEDMYRGDCLTMFQGAVDEFQGFTEMKNPFWTVDLCKETDAFCEVEEPKCRHLIPAPAVITGTELGDPLAMEKLESALVTVTNVTASSEFRRCDLNGDGAIDYSNDAEDQCKEDCDDEVGCVTKEDFDRYFTWTVDVDGVEVGIVTRGIVDHDPESEANLGVSVYSITGTLKHLSFGSPAWIITPRDQDDFCLVAADCQ